jgi:hypothetical protein
LAHANCDLPTSNSSLSALTFSGGTNELARQELLQGGGAAKFAGRRPRQCPTPQ